MAEASLLCIERVEQVGCGGASFADRNPVEGGDRPDAPKLGYGADPANQGWNKAAAKDANMLCSPGTANWPRLEG